jgi:hypothetical protein
MLKGKLVTFLTTISLAWEDHNQAIRINNSNLHSNNKIHNKLILIKWCMEQIQCLTNTSNNKCQDMVWEDSFNQTWWVTNNLINSTNSVWWEHKVFMEFHNSSGMHNSQVIGMYHNNSKLYKISLHCHYNLTFNFKIRQLQLPLLAFQQILVHLIRHQLNLSLEEK